MRAHARGEARRHAAPEAVDTDCDVSAPLGANIAALTRVCFALQSAMMSMAFKEGIKVPPPALNEIILAANQDVRQVSHGRTHARTRAHTMTRTDARAHTHTHTHTHTHMDTHTWTQTA